MDKYLLPLKGIELQSNTQTSTVAAFKSRTGCVISYVITYPCRDLSEPVLRKGATGAFYEYVTLKVITYLIVCSPIVEVGDWISNFIPHMPHLFLPLLNGTTRNYLYMCSLECLTSVLNGP